MLVARVAEGELVVVDRLREMVQLASGLDDSRRLSREAQQRALDCLQRFGQRVRHLPPGSVRVVGTNTLRSARNAAQFIRAAELALGHPIETISGIEEARLIYLGVAQTMADQAGRRLVVDIGGGSTELVIGEQAQPVHMESLYVGCVSLSRRFFPDGEITSGALRRAELAVRQELEPVEAEFRRRGWQQTVGASGTIRTPPSAATSQLAACSMCSAVRSSPSERSSRASCSSETVNDSPLRSACHSAWKVRGVGLAWSRKNFCSR